MKRVPVLILMFAAAVALAAQPSVAVVLGNPDDVSIPLSIREAVPETDLVSAYCHEFKWRAGGVISQIEALHETVDAKLEQFKPLGIVVSTSDYVDSSADLRRLMSEVCSASSLRDSMVKSNEYRAEGMRLQQQTARDNFYTPLYERLEREMTERQESFRTELEDEMRAEVADLEAEAYARLEAQLRAEAESRKQEMVDRIQKQVEAELIAEYGHLPPEELDIPYLQRLGEQRGKARGEAEAASVEAELREKYDRLAAEEVEKLKAAAEEKALEKGEKMRASMGDMGDVSAEMDALAQAKYEDEWAGFKEIAIAMRKSILKKVVEAQFDEARAIAREENLFVQVADDSIREQYGLQSTEDLLADIDRSEKEVLAQLADATDATDEEIEAFRKKFSESWESLRQRLTALKDSSVDIVMERVRRALEISGPGDQGRVMSYLSSTATQMRKNRERGQYWDSQCTLGPTRSPFGTKGHCEICGSRTAYADLMSYGDRAEKKMIECMGLVGQFQEKDRMAKSGALDIVSAMTYGNEVKRCLEAVREMHDPFVELKKAYERKRDELRRSCANR